MKDHDLPGGLYHPDIAEAGVDELRDILGCDSHPPEEFSRSETGKLKNLIL